MGDKLLVARHEEIADSIFACLRQGNALLRHLLVEKAVRDLDENAGAVAHQRIGTDRAAVGQVFEHEEAVARSDATSHP